MCVSCWVLLGLEQGIEIPERTLNKVIGWHLSKPDPQISKETVSTIKLGAISISSSFILAILSNYIQYLLFKKQHIFFLTPSRGIFVCIRSGPS